MAGRIKWSDGQGVMVNRCPTGHLARGYHEPVTPTRCALQCHGLRVNRCPADISVRMEGQSPTTRTPDGTRVAGVRQDGRRMERGVAGARQDGRRMGHGWRVPDKTGAGWDTGGGCPTGHRFNSSPRHRSAMRAGVGGKDDYKNVVSDRTRIYRSVGMPLDGVPDRG